MDSRKSPLLVTLGQGQKGNSYDVGPIGFSLDYLERLKVKVTNGAVTAIGMCGYTPVGLTGVLVCLSAGIFVTHISGVGRHRAMKFCRMVDLGVRQIFSTFGELWRRG